MRSIHTNGRSYNDSVQPKWCMGQETTSESTLGGWQCGDSFDVDRRFEEVTPLNGPPPHNKQHLLYSGGQLVGQCMWYHRGGIEKRTNTSLAERRKLSKIRALGQSAYRGLKIATKSLFFVHSVAKGYYERKLPGDFRYWTRVGHGQHILWLQFSLTNHCVWENDVRSAKNYT